MIIPQNQAACGKDTNHKPLNALEKAQNLAMTRQKSVKEEKRLVAILQMIGVAAHELNQPLTSLLGHLELVQMNKGQPEKLLKYASRIEETGEKIAGIVKKIQDLRHEHCVHDTVFSNYEYNLNILYACEDKNNFDKVSALLKDYAKIEICTPAGSEQALPEDCGLVFVDFSSQTHEWKNWANLGKESDKPVVLMVEHKDKAEAFDAVCQGLADFAATSSCTGPMLIKILTNACELAFTHGKTQETVQRLASVALKDDLTNLCGRLHFQKAVEKEISRAPDLGRTSSLCLMSLDNMDKILKDFGPGLVNPIFAGLGKIFRMTSTREDLPSRYEPDKFAVLLPGRTSDEAVNWCEDFTQKLHDQPFEWFGKQFPLTMTFGIAPMPEKGQAKSFEKWLDRAANALDLAKKQGPGTILTAVF